MKTTIRTSLAIHSLASKSWAQISAGLGAAVWAAIAVLARARSLPIGSIELIFLFAPLVIVPLGVELMRVIGGASQFDKIARQLQPIGAALAALSLCLPPGKPAGILASAWTLICLLLAISWPAEVFQPSKSASTSSLLRVILAFARLDLAVGAAWFLASRLALHPLGTQEPIMLLTAVHFHFAGFTTATIGAAMLRFTEQGGTDRWLERLLPLVVGMPYVVAAGFVISPKLKMAAAVVFSASIAALAIVLRSLARSTESRTARAFLYTASASVFAGMVLSSVYAIADLHGSDVLPIPQMARTHGLLNAIGFCLPALLGWLIELP